MVTALADKLTKEAAKVSRPAAAAAVVPTKPGLFESGATGDFGSSATTRDAPGRSRRSSYTLAVPPVAFRPAAIL
jgi:hypothetical protein